MEITTSRDHEVGNEVEISQDEVYEREICHLSLGYLKGLSIKIFRTDVPYGCIISFIR